MSQIRAPVRPVRRFEEEAERRRRRRLLRRRHGRAKEEEYDDESQARQRCGGAFRLGVWLDHDDEMVKIVCERETQLSQPSGRTAELNTENKHGPSYVGRKQTRTRIKF